MGLKTISPNRIAAQLKEVSFFTMAGLANTFTDFFVFNILLRLFPTEHDYSLVGYSVVGFLLANVQSYWLNKNLTFRSKGSKNQWDRYASFFLISIFSLGVNSLAFYLLQRTPLPHTPFVWNIEKLCASGIGIVFNFFGYQKIVFRVSGKLSTITNDAVCLKPYQGTALPELTLVVPAYNEASRMERTLEEFIHFSQRYNSLEVLIVDDGSTDGTSSCIENHYLDLPYLTHYRLKDNWGKGGAVRFGLSKAKGKYVFFCDADLSFPLNQLDLLRKDLDLGADVVVGIRKQSSNQPVKRKLQSTLFRKLVQFLNLTTVEDTQCGFKGFKASALQMILPDTECCDFTFDVELLALAKREKLCVKEKSIHWHHQQGSTIRPTHIIQMLYSLVILRIRLGGLITPTFRLGCLLFLLSLCIRLPYLYDVPHFIDEWGEVRLASQIARGEVWPLHNTAHDIGAFYNYLLALFFALFGHQLFIPRFLVTLFSAGTVVLTFLLAKQWTSLGTAFVAGLLLATNSMHILVTHMAWSNDITPFFVTLSVLLTVRTLRKNSSLFSWALCGFVWALALQTHSSVLAPLIGGGMYLWRTWRAKFRRIHQAWYFLAAFFLGYINMIVHNIIKPLDSIFWIRHKDYALNRSISLSSYWTNIENMAIELARSLTSTFPNGTGVIHIVSILIMYIMVIAMILSLPVLFKKEFGKLLLYILIASFVIIPLFNSRYVYFISTRYIAYLFPICYVMLVIGLDQLAIYMRDAVGLHARFRMGFIGTVFTCGILLLPLYHFYSYAIHYIHSGEDNSAEYFVVQQLLLLNTNHDTVYVDMGSKQGKAIMEMLRIKGMNTRMVGDQPKVQMVAAGHGKGYLDYRKWKNAVHQNKSGWFALSPSHVGPLTEHFHIAWDKTFYITRANGETAYFIGKIHSVGLHSGQE